MAPSLLPIPVSAVGREVHLEVAGVLPTGFLLSFRRTAA